MTRLAIRLIAAAAFVALAAQPVAAQSTFKVPFPFESGGKKFAAGSYVVTKTAEGQVTVKQVTTGKESAVPYTETLKPAEPPATGPRLVFDEVGDFAPSYTEYITVYVLAEVWLSGQEGYRIHTTKGAHKSRVITGGPSKN
ncbi:MAG: hypothetical protein ACM3NQ_15375 [Bacteroidales bacterium]